MIRSFTLFPGITLRCFHSDRFKQGCLSVQFVRLMKKEEAALNALIPAVLLRGTQHHKDLRAITARLDDLYGASVSALVRRVGDYQTTGLYCGFMEDRFALEGDRILEPMVDFLRELLLEPLTEKGGFSREFVESEKKNLISTIESERNDKRTYAVSQLLQIMCRKDSFGVPRLGNISQVKKIGYRSAYAHYQKVLKESPVEIFYVGAGDPETVAERMKLLFAGLQRDYRKLPDQSPFQDCGGAHRVEKMAVTQAKLSMGFVTPITNRTEDFAAMQLLNTVYGAGMTSKLFTQIREKMSLCYSIGSGYYGSKGILTVNAGIDAGQEKVVREEVLHQLALCQQVTQQELAAAKEAVLSSLRGVHDSPGAIEGYYATAALSGICFTLPQYMAAVEAVTPEQIGGAAKSLQYHSSYLLRGATK